MADMRGGGALLAALFFVAVWLAYPYERVFQFNPDEGVTAGKALLVAGGADMYSEIWSDQPPLFTHLLSVWMELVDWDVDRGRLLSLAFGALLLGCTYEIGRASRGRVAGVTAVLLLCLSTYFLRLSVSLMVGLPAVALATSSLLAATRYGENRSRRTLLVSGLLFGASLATKLFVVPIGVVIAGLVAAKPLSRGRPWNAMRDAGLWSGVALLTFGVVLAWLGGAAAMSQLLTPHLTAQHVMAAGGVEYFFRDAEANAPILLLALCGIVAMYRDPRPASIAATVWAAGITVTLLVHRPYWYHHQLLLSVPSSILGGLAIGDLVARARMGVRLPRMRALASTGLLLFLLTRVYLTGLPDPQVPTAYHADFGNIVSTMRLLAPQTRVVLTDLPMFAVRARLPVYPSLAVVTQKRMAVGDLTADDFVDRIERDQPEQVVLGSRFPKEMRNAIVESLEDGYVLLEASSWPPHPRLYARRDLLANTPTTTAATARTHRQ